MKSEFWIKEEKLKQIYTESIVSKNQNASFWEVFSDYEPKYTNQKFNELETDNFLFPQLIIAKSKNTIGLGNMRGFIKQEEIVENKFQEYRTEITELLKLQPDFSLRPSTSNSHFDKENWNTFYNFKKMNPFITEFTRGQFLTWKHENKILFLTVTKGEKQLPYQIKLGGLTYKKYKDILESHNKIYELKNCGQHRI